MKLRWEFFFQKTKEKRASLIVGTLCMAIFFLLIFRRRFRFYNKLILIDINKGRRLISLIVLNMRGGLLLLFLLLKKRKNEIRIFMGV